MALKSKVEIRTMIVTKKMLLSKETNKEIINTLRIQIDTLNWVLGE